MNIINIKKLTDSLHEIDWNYDFKITKKSDGSGVLYIPDFIMNNLDWAITEGRPTPKEQVNCCSEI